MKTVKFLFGLLKGQRVRYYTAIALGVVISLIPLTNNYLVKVIVDDVIVAGRNNLLIPILIALFCLTLARVSIWYYVHYVIERTGQKIMLDVRNQGFKKLLSMEFSFFDKTRTGDLMTRMTADVDFIRHFFSHVFYTLIEQSVFFLGALCFMMTAADVSFLVMAAIVMPLAIYMAVKLAFSVKPRYRKVRELRAVLNTVAQENIEANRVVRAFVREDLEREKMRIASENFKLEQFNVNRIWRRYMPFLSNIQMLFTIYNIVVGGILVMTGKMSMGDLVMFNGMVWMITGPLTQYGFLANDVANCLASTDKLIDLLNTDTEIKPVKAAPIKKRIDGNIDFISVSFGYDGAEHALHDATFHVKAGETIGLIGSAGSGKSTIINLISRFYDVDHGVILIDGEDIKNIDLDTLRGSIAVAQQDVFLFSNTIRENIAFGTSWATDKDIIKAAKAAKAHDFIMELPEGYDTIVGERGVGLSGGQKQRLTLARALLHNPSILVLDDTTSALDAETERDIQWNLSELFGNKTVFIISQRISSVKDCDQILVLENGDITERGKHQDLVNAGGYYSRVFRHQFSELADAQKGGEPAWQK
ncbi:ABC transporter ATP-binding protein [Ructibacterium gallinarum]|uniref:ABC transporter ATP-binding protein n=1 Tax=Ructibacterium gallinarum TaxID=2779355 RepID=A0A9D5M637_9FIRM|nr:ABC transporter ATP-binding protein [Ructibacterium gallinarum]MBE5040249.1 ABC transporter ATP-binding protein [Ructibacterium gallinarum]